MWRHPCLNENFPAEVGALAWDVLNIATHQLLAIELLGLSDEFEQAVSLTVHVGKGEVQCDDLVGRGLTFWLTGKVRRLDVIVDSSEGLLTVSHAWKEPPKGGNPATIWTEKDFSAMLVEELGNRRVYRCNNGRRDEDFDKLVFAVELLDSP